MRYKRMENFFGKMEGESTHVYIVRDCDLENNQVAVVGYI